MDRVDTEILARLQADGRLSVRELSRRVRLSPPAVADRVRRLLDQGVITGYHAHVDPIKVGRPVRAVIHMQCYGSSCVLRDPAVADWPEIEHFYRVTGDACSVLVVAVESMSAFESLIDRLAAYGQPSSSMVLADLVPFAPVTPAP